VAAVFPGRYPREVLEALGFLPVEVWDPPLEPMSAGAHLQPFTCGVVRRGLELVLRDGLPADILVFPHTCDSLQNLFSIVRDLLPEKRPCVLFCPPRLPAGDDHSGFPNTVSRRYLEEAISEFARQVEQISGRSLSDEALAQAASGRVAARNALRQLYQRRASGALPCTNTAFYEVVRANEYLPSSKFVSRVADFLAHPPSPPRIEHPPAPPHISHAADFLDHAPALPRTRALGHKWRSKILLSGVLPDWPLLKGLDDAGALVVEDDLLSCGRRFSRWPEDPGGPAGSAAAPRGPRKQSGSCRTAWNAIVDGLANLPPCPSWGSSLEARRTFLDGRLVASGAKGIVFHAVKFCEVEAFDHPLLTGYFVERHVPCLVVESEIRDAGDARLAVRLEAFMEGLS